MGFDGRIVELFRKCDLAGVLHSMIGHCTLMLSRQMMMMTASEIEKKNALIIMKYFE